MKITEALFKEFGISLQQGIPVPFKTHESRTCKFSPIPENILREPKKSTQSNGHHPEDPQNPKTPPENPEVPRNLNKPKKNCANGHKMNYCGSLSKGREYKPKEAENLHQNNEFNETINTFGYSSPVAPQNLGKMEFSSCRSAPPKSKVGKMMKGIFRKCKNTMKSISNRPSADVSMNFVCYRCNYPCFRLCKSEGYSQLTKASEKKIIFEHSDDVDNLEVVSVTRVKKNRNSEVSKHGVSRRKPERAERPVRKALKTNDWNDDEEVSRTVTSGTDSTSAGSFVDVLERKLSDRGNIPFEGRSKDTLASKASSERLKQYIYDVFPPILERMPSGDDRDDRAWTRKGFPRNGNHQIEDGRGEEGDGGELEENSSLQTEFPEEEGSNGVAPEQNFRPATEFPGERRGHRNFKMESCVLEAMGGTRAERNSTIGPMTAEPLSRLFDYRRKLLGDFVKSRRRLGIDDSRDLAVLHGTASMGGIDEHNRSQRPSMDRLIDEYSEG